MAVNQLGDGSADGVQLPNTAFGAFGVAPVTQPGASAVYSTGAAGATTSVYLNTTFTGNVGTSAYSIGGLVAALKALGLIAM